MDQSLDRYHRQILLPGFGEEGQRRLLDSTALILGCGALGSVAADLLARAGVGRLLIVDRDIVETTNLQRQVLFDERDAAEGLPKAVAAKRRIARNNSQVEVTAIVDDIHYGNIERLAQDADVLVDGLDNFETRYLANDLAVKTGRPYVYGAAVGTAGMGFSVLPHGSGKLPWESAQDGSFATPCFRCLFDEPPPPGSSPTCDTVGVVSAVVGLIANVQVAETLKILTGQYSRVRRSLLSVDLWQNEYLNLGVDDAYSKGDCACCKHRRFDYLDGKAGSAAVSLCGRDAVQLRHREGASVPDLEVLAQRFGDGQTARLNEFMLVLHITDSNKPYEITVFRDGRAIVKGTHEPAVARTLFARYIGS
ncbi:MAG: ThiF family adenylyltransferase [Pseudomonadota bacterium]